MLTLGIDPGQRHVGWSVIEDGLPIAGGTLSARGRRLSRILTNILTHMEEDVGTRFPDAIAVENGNTNLHTTTVIATAEEFARRHRILLVTTSPTGKVRIPRRSWSSGHEKDACKAAVLGERALQIEQGVNA